MVPDRKPRGHWGIIPALAGLAALATAFSLGLALSSLNDPQEQRYQSYRYTPDEPPGVQSTATRQPSAQPLPYRTPCEHPKGEGESELCAEWRSAKAGEESALWTKRGVWIGIVGSVLLLYQIALTRKAVEDTDKATVAMHRANEISEDTARRQLRAYIGVTGAHLLPLKIGEYPELTFKVENHGATPAHNLRVRAKVFVFKSGHAENVKIRFGYIRNEGNSSLGSGAVESGSCYYQETITSECLTKIEQSQLSFILAGIISYRDVFGKRHLTTFKTYLAFGALAEHDKRRTLIICRNGNTQN